MRRVQNALWTPKAGKRPERACAGYAPRVCAGPCSFSGFLPKLKKRGCAPGYAPHIYIYRFPDTFFFNIHGVCAGVCAVYIYIYVLDASLATSDKSDVT